MSEISNFRIVVNLSNYFNDHRHRARIFVNERIQTVQDLHDKISSVFHIENFHLSTQNEFLPPSEDVRILRQDEILWVNPVEPDRNSFKQSKLEDTTNSRKCKSKRKAELETNEHSSDDLWIPKKRKKSEKVLEYNSVRDKTKKAKKYRDEDLDGTSPNIKRKPLRKHHDKNKKISSTTAINEELTLPKKCKKKKKHVELDSIEMEVGENSIILSTSNKGPDVKEMVNHENIDDSFLNNELLCANKHNEVEPHLSRTINKNGSDIKSNEDTQKKSKNKKKLNQLDSTELVKDADSQRINNEKPGTSKQIANQENIDETYRRKQLVYTKSSPLPTITDQYLKEKKINIVKIDYVVGNPSSTIFGGKQQSNEIIQNEDTENLVEDQQHGKCLGTENIAENKLTNIQNEIAISAKILDNKKMKIHWDVNQNKHLTEGDISSDIKDNDNRGHLMVLENSNKTDSRYSDANNLLVSSNNEEFGDLPVKNDSNPIMPNRIIPSDNVMSKPKYFFFSSPSMRNIGRTDSLTKKEVPVTFDENGKQNYKPRFFKTPSYIEFSPVKQKVDKTKSNLENINSNEETKIIQSTNTKLEENVIESESADTKPSEELLFQTNQILTTSASNECSGIVLEESQYESDICLNETVELSKDEQSDISSSVMSGIHRITPSPLSSRFSRSRHQISGVGSVLDDLRKSDISKTSPPHHSTLDSDCSNFVTKRKRVRKRTKKKSRETPIVVEPKILPPLKPMNVKGAPSIHIKFDADGEIENGGSVSKDVSVIEVDCDDIKTSLDDIAKAPLMSSMKPRVGDIIAFKVLKLGPNYIPELSSHITGQVTEFHNENNQVTFEIIGGLDQCKEPEGKFSMNQNGAENANFEDRRREYDWSSLIEPRLLYP